VSQSSSPPKCLKAMSGDHMMLLCGERRDCEYCYMSRSVQKDLNVAESLRRIYVLAKRETHTNHVRFLLSLTLPMYWWG
jgi:hypothetical protein